MTDRAWSSRLVRHPVRKRSGSILTTPEPARGQSTGGNLATGQLRISTEKLDKVLLSRQVQHRAVETVTVA